jgi:hypothetical protein
LSLVRAIVVGGISLTGSSRRDKGKPRQLATDGASLLLGCCFIVGGLFLPLGANDAAGHAELIRNHEVEPVTALVRPDGSDFAPDGFLVAAFLRIGNDVGDVAFRAVRGVQRL